MKRREFIAGLGAVALPLAARAQQPERMRRIGVLMPGEENEPALKTYVSAFTQALADLGWRDGRNVRMDVRLGGSDINRIRALAQELVGLQPDAILTGGTPPTVALQRETRTIPIVFTNLTDPVASGLVSRPDRPSGNITGFAVLEPSLGGKWLELLLEIAPGLKRATIMFNPDTINASLYLPSLEAAARLLKVVPIIAPVHSDVEIETAIALGREPGDGLVAIPDLFTFVHRAPIILAAARNQVPAIYYLSDFARDGGLLSYGPDAADSPFNSPVHIVSAGYPCVTNPQFISGDAGCVWVRFQPFSIWEKSTINVDLDCFVSFIDRPGSKISHHTRYHRLQLFCR